MQATLMISIEFNMCMHIVHDEHMDNVLLHAHALTSLPTFRYDFLSSRSHCHYAYQTYCTVSEGHPLNDLHHSSIIIIHVCRGITQI